MFELSRFYHYCTQNNVDVIPYLGMPSAGATIRDGSDVAVFLDFGVIRTTRQLRGVCMHEQGHVATGALHKISSPYDLVERSEYRANRWAAEHYLTADDFREAFASGYTELWQMAEYFDLPEKDIKNALTYWSERRSINFFYEDPAARNEQETG